MKRGKGLFENENMFIYVGTAIFFVLAIALGIIMYMLTKTTNELENGAGIVVQEKEVEPGTESASTEIGKTVEEQKNTATEQNDEINNTTSDTENENVVTNTENANEAEETAESNTTETNLNPETNNTPNTTEENKITESKKEITFTKPVEGEIICEFAKDNLIYSETLKEWITHTAIDIKTDKTSVIKSAADGIIKSIVNDPRYGLTIVIEHDEGYETVYSNLLTAEFVVESEEVTQGQTIGTAGNSASFESAMECHLHFEILKDGEYLNPAIYLK